MNRAVAKKRLNKAFIFEMLMLAMIGSFFIVKSDAHLLTICFVVYLIFYFLFHIYLGMSAKSSGRSWVYFGLLPVLWPAVGGVISSIILYFALKSDSRKFATATITL